MMIYLIRHGLTEANERHLYCGASDLPLSETGRSELKKLRYSVPAACAFYTSGMRRCNESVEILFGSVVYKIVPELREMDFGVFELRSYEQLKDDALYQAWITGDNEQNITPDGESGLMLRERALKGYRNILRTGKNSVIVTHGGVIAAIMAELFPLEDRNRYEWQPLPGHGYAVTEEGFREIP